MNKFFSTIFVCLGLMSGLCFAQNANNEMHENAQVIEKSIAVMLIIPDRSKVSGSLDCTEKANVDQMVHPAEVTMREE